MSSDGGFEFTLWPACVQVHPFEEQVKAARQAGFDSLAISPVLYRSLKAAGWSDQRIREYPRDHGIRLSAYDGFSDWAPLRYGARLPDAAKAIFDVSQDDCLAICEALELRSICATAAFETGEVSIDAMRDGFGAFAARAGAIDVRVDLEFLPMWAIPDLNTAWDVLGGCKQVNAGILLDTWHFMRGNPDMTLLRSLPAGVIQCVQLADASATPRSADLFEDTLLYRQFPGEGELPLVDILQALMEHQMPVSIGPEIYSLEANGMSANEAAERAAGGSQSVIDAARAR